MFIFAILSCGGSREKLLRISMDIAGERNHPGKIMSVNQGSGHVSSQLLTLLISAHALLRLCWHLSQNLLSRTFAVFGVNAAASKRMQLCCMCSNSHILMWQTLRKFYYILTSRVVLFTLQRFLFGVEQIVGLGG